MLLCRIKMKRDADEIDQQYDMQQVYVNFFNLDVTNIYTIIDYYFEIMQNVRQKNINNLLVPRCPWISNSIDKNLKSS